MADEDQAQQTPGARTSHAGAGGAAIDAAAILDSITDAFYVLDHDWRLVFVNEAALGLWRRSPAELLGNNLWELFPQYQGSDAQRRMGEAMRDRRPVHFEVLSPVTGLWISASCYPSGDGLACYFRDVGARKDAEAALSAEKRRAELAEREAREARTQLEEAIETMSEGFVVYDAEDRLVLCNRRYREIYAESADIIAPGRSFEEMLRIGLARGQYRDAVGREEEWLQERLAAHREARGGFEQRLPGDRWVRIVERRTGSGGTVGVRVDVTELRRREADLARWNAELETRVAERTRSLAEAIARLRGSEQRYAALFEHSPTILYVLERGADGQLVLADINPAGARSCGAERADMLGRTVAEIFPAPFAEEMERRHAECAATRRTVEFDVAGELPAGFATWHAELVPLPGGEGGEARIFGTAVDLTEPRRLEQQLREAQKMQAVGQLAGGVAHDFNNLLTAVLGNVELVLGSEADARKRRLLEGARRAAERGADLTRQLLAFSRRQRLAVAPVDVNGRIRGMLDLLRRSLGPGIATQPVLEPALWPASTDATQLELALLNLAINARDAMPEGGRLTIETRNLPSGARRPRDLPTGDLPKGDLVVIAVADTGTGMPEDVRAKAFEPFFTTKDVGKGSGLGLAQVYAVAEQSGGGARIESREGLGTTVSIFLPRAVAAAADCPEVAAAPRAGSAALLLVDDEIDVREFAATSLRELGYSVAEAADGAAALAALRAAPPDLLILDYAMPGMNGVELMRAARALYSELPMVLVTGYAAGDLGEAEVPEHVLLPKPFRQAELARAVESALRRARRGPERD